KWYLEEVDPILRKKVSDYSIELVGKGAPKAFKTYLKQFSNVISKGFVDDLKDVYRNAKVCIAPMVFVAGQQNKVLEAMMAGVPVVATSFANGGIKAMPDKEILIADSAEEFAKKIQIVFEDSNKADQLANAAQSFVLKDFQWENVPNQF
ncbi:MAG: glycosyltransferase family 4 protein, partial [Candidatus Margulisiibacteriota bacterium]